MSGQFFVAPMEDGQVVTTAETNPLPGEPLAPSGMPGALVAEAAKREQRKTQMHLQVAVEGGRVLLLIEGRAEGIAMAPEQALHLATVIRTKANEILHKEHQALARLRRERRDKIK